MTNELQPTSALIDERTDILFREIELATRWERPSILFAIYRSDDVRDRVMKCLAQKLGTIHQNVQFMTLTDDEQVNSLNNADRLAEYSRSILFLDGFKNEDEQFRSQTFEQINRYREYFIDNSLRAVFWLLEQDVQRFAMRATECWYLRHRVIDFTDDARPAEIFLNTLESCMQEQNSGSACSRLGQLEAEVSEASEELVEQPSHGMVLYILGQLWLKKNDTGNALKFLQSALEIGDSTEDSRLQGRCLVAMAKIEAGLGHIPEAVELYRKALPFSIDTASTWKDIAHLELGSGKHQQAVDALLNALRFAPQDATAWLQLGNTYMILEQFDNAGSAFENALELDANAAAAWYGLGKVYLMHGQGEHAMNALQKAVQIDPQVTSAWSALAQAYLSMRRESDALLAYEKAAAAGTEDAQVWAVLGNLYLKQKKFEHAIIALQRALALDPESGPATRDLGMAEFHNGNYERATILLEQAVPLFSDRGERAAIWKTIAESCLQLGQEDMAAAAYKQSLRLSDQPVDENIEDEVPAERAQELPQNENGEPAMIESSNTFEERTAKDWNDIGNSYLNAGAYKKAVFAFTKAIEMATENNWPYIKNLAVANYKLGKKSGRRTPLETENAEVWEVDDDDDDELACSPQDDLPESRRYEQPPDGVIEDPAAEEELVQGEDHQPCAPALSAEDLNEAGNRYAADGNFEQAIETYKLAIQTDPRYGQPYSNLGFLYFKRGEYRLAAILFQKAIEFLTSNEDRATTLNRLGDTFHHLHRYDDAFLAYKKAREMAPSRTPLLDRARISVLQNAIR